MLNANRELLLTRSLFHEATTQLQRMFSTSTIHELEKDNNSNKPGDKSLITIIYIFSKHFSKMYLIRIAFMLLSHISRRGLKLGLLNILYNSTFTMKNFRTSFMVGVIPLIYDLLHKIGKHYLDIDTKGKIFTFVAGFISAYIGISFENMTELMKFVVLSILGRVIYSIFTIIAIKNGYPGHNHLVSFIAFTLICTVFNALNYFVPSFKPITNLVDKYSLAKQLERNELNHYRQIHNIFKA